MGSKKDPHKIKNDWHYYLCGNNVGLTRKTKTNTHKGYIFLSIVDTICEIKYKIKYLKHFTTALLQIVAHFSY